MFEFIASRLSFDATALLERSSVSIAWIPVGTAIAIACLTFAVGRLFIGSRNQGEEFVGSRDRRPLFGPLTKAFAELLPMSSTSLRKVRKEIQQAGYYHRQATDEFLAFRNFSLSCWILFSLLFLIASLDDDRIPKWQSAAFCAGCAAAIYGLPRLVLQSMAASRAKRIQHAMPDALDLITMVMLGGIPLQSALKRVAREIRPSHPDLACELEIVEFQTQSGSLEAAVGHFADRIDVPDVLGLAALVRHAARLGSNVSTAFRDYADQIRQTRRVQAEERGNKASVKILFPIVLFLTPPIYILLLGPAVLELRSFLVKENAPGGLLQQGAAAEAAENFRNLD